MTDAGRLEIAPSQVDQAIDPGLEALRGIGAERFDPVRFRFLETLARRVHQHQGAVKRILDGRLTEALAAYRKRFEQKQDEVQDTIARLTERFPEVGDDLQRLFCAGDWRAMNRFVVRLENRHAPLADLARYIAQLSPQEVDGGLADEFGPRRELKAIRHFRNTWSKLSVDKQVAQAIEQAPENAGPLNSHMLVLRSLALMRDISPDYLKRFMSYADTLLTLDCADGKNKPMVKKPLTAKTTVNSGRGQSR